MKLNTKGPTPNRCAAILLIASFIVFGTGCSKQVNTKPASARGLAPTGGEKFGAAPSTEVEPQDIFVTYKLPRMRDVPDDLMSGPTGHLQMVARAHDLGILNRSAVRSWQSSSSIALLARQTELPSQGELKFNGSKASELNRELARSEVKAIRVVTPDLYLDQPITIKRSNVRLDLGSIKIRGEIALPYLIRIEGAKDVDLRGGELSAGDSGVLIVNAERVRVADMSIAGLNGTGMVLSNSRAIVLRRNHITGLKYAAILLGRDLKDSLIEENQIEKNLGTSDLASGIVLTHREVDLKVNARAVYAEDGYHFVTQGLSKLRHPPMGNLVQSNRIEQNQALGIYSDGGVRNVFVGNVIVGNAKQGIGLASASTANMVAANSVRRNGSRWGEPDAVLVLEGVADSGRLPDGTPASKLPGISLDNALYNVVFQNTIANNAGDGIRLVRTGVFNVIGVNTILNNAAGENELFRYYGVELSTPDAESTAGELASLPSRANQIFSNIIRGGHYAAIYLGRGSDENSIFDNILMEAKKWSIEAPTLLSNFVVNNLATVPSKNVQTAFDGNMMFAARPVMDDEFMPSESSVKGTKSTLTPQ